MFLCGLIKQTKMQLPGRLREGSWALHCRFFLLHLKRPHLFAVDFEERRHVIFAAYAVARCLSVRPSVCHMPVFCRNG